MATLSESIYDILHTDAQSAVAGSLGVLLSYNAVTKPQCVFFRNPPDKPDFPQLVYFIGSQVREPGSTQLNPRNLFFTFTAFGDNFEAVQDRVFTLLQRLIELSTSDYSVKSVLFDASGPELWDEDWQVYYRADIYRVIAVKI